MGQGTRAWTLFPHLIVRSTGFPYNWLHDLQARQALETTTEILGVESEIAACKKELLASISNIHSTTFEIDPALRKTLRRLEFHIRRHIRPLTGGNDPRLASTVEAWNVAVAKYDLLRRRAAADWPTWLGTADRRLWAAARNPYFQEAVFLNSPSALAGVRQYASTSRPYPRRAYHRRLVMRYLQRFCGKCETASFFGPINFGEVSPERGDSVRYGLVGASYLAQRVVKLSYWAAQEIADTIARDPEAVGALRLYSSAVNTAPPLEDVNGLSSKLLAAADGSQSLQGMSSLFGYSLGEVVEQSYVLQDQGLVLVGLRIPASADDPVATLRQMIFATEVPSHYRLTIERLETLCSDFRRASYPRRQLILREAEHMFEAATGREAWRGAGGIQADRSIVNEEAVGNISEFLLGRGAVEVIQQRLGTALDVLASRAVSAREKAARQLSHLALPDNSILIAEIADRSDFDCVDEIPLWRKVITDTSQSQVSLTREDLTSAGLIRSDLDNWPLFCAPDIMLVASKDQLGDLRNVPLVLSEVHHILPPCSIPFRSQHPTPAAVMGLLRAYMNVMVEPGELAMQRVERQNKALDFSPLDNKLLCLDWIIPEPRSKALPISAVKAFVSESGRLHLTGDGRDLMLVPSYPEEVPPLGILRHFALPAIDKAPICLAKHTPRIVIEGVVFQREHWDLNPSERQLGSVEHGSYEEFLALYRWKTRHSMPDQVFVRFSGEPKPIFVDFTSVPSAEAYLHASRRADASLIVEMLPTSAGLWLECGDERFCSELRLTMFRLSLEQRSNIAVSKDTPNWALLNQTSPA